MARKKRITKKLFIEDEEVEVTFYHELDTERMASFLVDIERFHAVAERAADLYTQQFLHAILIIKHFTNYKINASSMEEFIKEGRKFTSSGVLGQFAENFDKTFINDVNQMVIMHFLAMYGEVPEYMNYGPNASHIQKMVREMEEYGFDDDDDYDDYDDLDDLEELEDDDWEDIESDNIKVESEFKNEIDFSFYQQAVKNSINKLLDEYNDYIDLYKTFGDEKYIKRANHLMRVLKGEEEYDEFGIRD